MTSKIDIFRSIRSLTDRNTPALRIKIRESLNLMRDELLKEMKRKFVKDRANRIADGIIDWDALNTKQETLLKSVILGIMDKAGKLAFGIKKQIKKLDFEIGFDVVNVEAVKIAEKITSELITLIDSEAKKNIKYLIRNGIKDGKTMSEVAKGIRLEQLGLTLRDLKASANYEAWLLINKPKLRAKEIERRVGVYERRKYRKRCDLIARTETSRAVSEGTILGYKQTGVKRVEFLAAAGSCEECGSLNGTTYNVNAASGIIPIHPACRCCFAPLIQRDI